jgi:hypothetical protein
MRFAIEIGVSRINYRQPRKLLQLYILPPLYIANANLYHCFSSMKKGRIMMVLPLQVIIQISDILLSTSLRYNHSGY